ncbi:MAG TPA: LysR family transcriptional regulator [Noviherbaspirillum sp.]|nr:LysR family transcriptional regulator [Noviherbaspirillum sp.]
MFDLRALKYFIAAYEEGSITAAARRCYIAQPSISAAIQNLEGTLGTRLFERARQGLTPTPDGEKLYPRAKDLLAESNAIVQSFTAPPQREIHLHLQSDMPVHRAAPLIDLLYREVPGMKLKLTQEGEACDLRLISDQYKRDNEWMQTLWEEDYVALIPANHPLRFKAQLELADLHGVPFIDRPECALSRLFAQVLARKKIAPDIRASVVREEAVPALVEMGVGIALLPETHCEGLRHAVVRPIKHGSGMKRRVGLACLASDLDVVKFVRQVKPALVQAYAMGAAAHQRTRHAAAA